MCEQRERNQSYGELRPWVYKVGAALGLGALLLSAGLAFASTARGDSNAPTNYQPVIREHDPALTLNYDNSRLTDITEQLIS